jgi:hypothetical protein
VNILADQNSTPYDLAFQECSDYQPIQTLKIFSMDDLEIAEDAGCDSCVRNNKGQCEIHEK